jgi:hypothetical protein
MLAKLELLLPPMFLDVLKNAPALLFTLVGGALFIFGKDA